MQPTCWREPKLPASYICISTSPRIITNSAPLVVIADLNSTLTRVCSTPKSDVTETTHLICIVQLKHLTFHSCILEHAEHKKTVMCCCSKKKTRAFSLIFCFRLYGIPWSTRARSISYAYVKWYKPAAVLYHVRRYALCDITTCASWW